MQNSINIFHDERKILSAYDNTFFKKNGTKWEEINNINVFKGTDEPSSNLGNKNDYYIQYEKVTNFLLYSEDFNGEGWLNLNNNFVKDSSLIYPKTNATKMIPNQTFGKHSLAYRFFNKITDNTPFWCFSLYVRPNEYNYFKLSLIDINEENGIEVTYSIVLNERRQYVVNYKLKKIGNLSEDELIYDDSTYGIIKENNGFYRIFISAKFTTISDLQAKFSILKNQNGVVTEEFANNNITSGLFINAAQLINGTYPTEYIVSNGYSYTYYRYKRLFIKGDGNWSALPEYISVFYGNNNPESFVGQDGDIYFHNPIIKVGEFVRFGKNTKFRCWKNGNTKYYTEFDEPKNGDTVFDSNFKPYKTVSSYVSSSISLSESYITFDGTTAHRDISSDDRIIKEPGVMFWNIDDNTYGYISEDGKVHNIIYNNKSLYNFDLVNQALTYSVNLFSQTYNTRKSLPPLQYESKFYTGQYQMGFNSGGHGNFWDYNNLRRFY